MSDEEDTLIGTQEEKVPLQIKANIKFEQNLSAVATPSE